MYLFRKGPKLGLNARTSFIGTEQNKVCFFLCFFFFFFFFFFVVFFSFCICFALLLCGLFCEAVCFVSYLLLFCSCVFQPCPFSIEITPLDEERATCNLNAFRTFVRFALVWFCLFPLPLGVWEGLLFVIVALPGLFSYLWFAVQKCCILGVSICRPQREKAYLLICAPNKEADQTAHMSSLIRFFVVRAVNLCILVYPKYAQLRFRSDRHSRNLIWVFVIRTEKLCIFGHPKMRPVKIQIRLRMRSLIWIFTGRLYPKVRFSQLRLTCKPILI